MAKSQIINIDIPNKEQFIRKMQDHADDVKDGHRVATEKAVKHVHEKVPKYPTATHQPYSFKSKKQFIFVVASIAEGSLQVPYRRTVSGGIGGSIYSEVKSISKGYVGVIGSNKVYAPWVISSESVGGKGPQSSYHEGVWFTLQKVVEDAWEDIKKIYRNEIMSRLK